MKAILEFDLPTDEEKFINATRGSDWKLLIWQLDQWLRSQIKYPQKEMSDDTYKAFEKSREQLHKILQEIGLKL